MPKKNSKRKLVGLVSENTGHRVYYTTKNTLATAGKLSLKKYNPFTRQHELFVETKKSLGRNEVKARKR
ncbi:MAG: 50S ribosomal protein L33 [Candidatus Chaera renei]|uniref:Large ribosomal subunit protein bL33 n=1 Tax=Candidatus Chaera renei TaxID=2506947 RepID=A0A4Q0AGC3_9BACT|nr:MAG: 50S ribosomal protein L33 [Candidatus Chaera renei]